jgi:predicted metal-dependent hydrolase
MVKPHIHTLIRSRRRTICLTITENAQVVVKAPFWITARYIEDFMNKKQNWIIKKLEAIKERPKAKIKEYENGEEFLYLGKVYNLRIVPSRIPVKLKDELEISTNVWPKHKEAVKIWYQEEAAKIIGDRCAYFSEIMDCEPVSIRISNATRRWGSCSARGKLNFSWRLVMAPIEILDYVVVHELAHLHELNHSRRFWAKVKSVLPDYKEKQKWLRKNEPLLSL